MPLSVVKLENVSVLEAVKAVVETPVAPVIAPAEVILIVGVDRNLLNPVAAVKLMPLRILFPLFAAAGKLIPLRMLLSLPFTAFVKAMLTPFTVVDEAPVLAFVKAKAEPLALLVVDEKVCANVPLLSVRLP